MDGSLKDLEHFSFEALKLSGPHITGDLAARAACVCLCLQGSHLKLVRSTHQTCSCKHGSHSAFSLSLQTNVKEAMGCVHFEATCTI